MSSAHSAPLHQNERIQFIDSIRGIALLGILLMNITAQSQAHMFYDKMDPRQSMTGLNFLAWGSEMLLFEGTMRGLFSILFGAGTLLLLTRLIKKNDGLEPVDIYYRRLLWLLVFGLINAFIFLWPGDILYPYAICGLLLFPFRNLSPKNLLWIAFAFLAIGTYRENSDLYHYKKIISQGQAAEVLATKKQKLTDQQNEDLSAYKGFKEKTSQAGVIKAAEKEEKILQSRNYFTIFNYYKGINMRIESSVFYKNYWFDILLFLFIGMALYKSGFLLGKSSTSVYALVAFIGIAAGLFVNFLFVREQYLLKFDQFQFIQKWKFSYYEIRRVFQTTGYLSLLILLYKAIPFRRVLHVFAPVGQMAFTNYLSQSIITSIVFYGFVVFGKLQRYEIYFVLAAIWLFQIVTSHIWLRYYKFGPFEWLWRSLTYLEKQPIKKKARAAEPEEEFAETPAPALA